LGGLDRAERNRESDSSNSIADRRHSAQCARCDSNRARSPGESSPSWRRERKSTDRPG
jgi:hypothetical protein